MKASYYLVEDDGIYNCYQICILLFSNNSCIQPHSVEEEGNSNSIKSPHARTKDIQERHPH
jgi:hypothetical protein